MTASRDWSGPNVQSTTCFGQVVARNVAEVNDCDLPVTTWLSQKAKILCDPEHGCINREWICIAESTCHLSLVAHSSSLHEPAPTLQSTHLPKQKCTTTSTGSVSDVSFCPFPISLIDTYAYALYHCFTHINQSIYLHSEPFTGLWALSQRFWMQSSTAGESIQCRHWRRTRSCCSKSKANITLHTIMWITVEGEKEWLNCDDGLWGSKWGCVRIA